MRVTFEQEAPNVVAIVREHYPKLNDDQLVLLLARATAMASRPREPQADPLPLSPDESRAIRAAMAAPDRETVERIEQECGVQLPPRRTGPPRRSSRWPGLQERVEQLRHEKPAMGPRTAWETLRDEHDTEQGPFIGYANFLRYYWSM